MKMMRVTSALAVLAALAAAQVTERWVMRYDGGASDMPFDAARAMRVDTAGNVYVTGYSVGPDSSQDIVTLKYDTDGVTLWSHRLNGPAADWDQPWDLATDAAGRTYVAGFVTGTREDYCTVRYGADGETLWTAYYNGPGNSLDQAYRLALDDQGAVYVTGCSYGLYSYGDIHTVKYDSTGAVAWSQRLTSSGDRIDAGKAIAVQDRQAYIAGTIWQGNSRRDDILVGRFGPTGETLWTAVYGGPGNWNDDPTDIAVDSSGRIYVAGWAQGPSNVDAVLLCYAPDGTQEWSALYNGTGNGDDSWSALVIGSGRIYVVGTSTGVGTRADILTACYTPDGDTLWTARYDGPASHTDGGSDIELDAQGNVYVTGWSSNAAQTNREDYCTIRYNHAGEIVWVMRYNGPAGAEDKPYRIGLDAQRNVYVTGESRGAGTQTDFCTIKYGQGSGAKEGPSESTTATGPRASVVRGVLWLGAAEGRHPCPVSLIDIAGRRTADLRSGPNDVSVVEPGVYFLGPAHSEYESGGVTDPRPAVKLVLVR
jgi:uncharacterized delta-60 repeat protein